jgi:hypothetical protein
MRGGGVRPRAARAHPVRESGTPRPCCRQVATTVSTRSTNRLPPAESVPERVSRQQTAWRSGRSAALSCGSTPESRLELIA